MKYFLPILLIANCSLIAVQAQPNSTGINNRNPSANAALDVQTSTGYKQGFLMPRLNTADTSNIGVTIGKDKGIMFYDTTSGYMRWWDGAKWNASTKNSSSTTNIGNPTGTILSYGGTTVPPDYLVCNGAEVSRTVYADLYSAIGISWGAGNGTSTFNLPDLRGRFLRGVDGGSGNDPDASTRIASGAMGNAGDNVGSVQSDEFRSHTHTQNAHNHIQDAHSHPIQFNSASTSGGTIPFSSRGTTGGVLMQPATTATNQATTATNQNTGGNETRPKNAYVSYIIKY